MELGGHGHKMVLCAQGVSGFYGPRVHGIWWVRLTGPKEHEEKDRKTSEGASGWELGSRELV